MSEEKNLLLIFDGLDELSMQSGTNAAEVSNRFITEVQDALRERKNVHWKAIITGRELSIQSQQHKLKKPKTIYHLLPYYIDEENREDFNDANKLLMTDQRSEWWRKLSKLKGLEFEDLPKELATKHLEPITTEPLLNYLISLSYLKEGGIVFSENTNLNEIYADLLDSVHERKYTDTGTHRSVDNMDKRKFIRILQEIALTVWHENGRTASVSQITEQCKKANIDSYFKEFTKDAESGIIRLLMAFYFRKFDGNNSDETFEFTHKSFGEYLTAKRIMLELSKMLNEVERFKEEADSGWTLEDAFGKWISVCGPQRIDIYLREFLDGEIQILANTNYGLQRVSKFQELLIELIQMAVNGQSPVKKLGLDSFNDDLIYSNNSEVALLEVHSLCAEYTKKVIDNVSYKEKHSFDTWLSRLNYLQDARLNYLDLSNLIFKNNFNECDFSSTILDNSFIMFNKIYQCNFKEVNIKDSLIVSVNFNDSSLLNVNFSEARIIDTEFRTSNFKESIFEKTLLLKVNFKECNLENVDLSESSLNIGGQVCFVDSNLENANFKNATIGSTRFIDSNLVDANFEDTNHEEAYFESSNLKGTILENLYPPKEEVEEEK